MVARTGVSEPDVGFKRWRLENAGKTGIITVLPLTHWPSPNVTTNNLKIDLLISSIVTKIMAEPDASKQVTELSEGPCHVSLTHDLLNVNQTMDKVRSPSAGAIVLFAGK